MLSFLGTSNELSGDLASFLIKTMPLAMMIINDEVKVKGINDAATKFLCISKEDANLKKCGDVLKCVNAKYPGGCGSAPRCVKCVLRKSVLEALAGQVVSRNKGIFDIVDNGELKRLTLLITAAPINYKNNTMVLVLTEDVSLVTQLEGLIPICSSCHHICDEHGNWVSLEKYLQMHSEAELTHDFCPVCSDKMRAEYASALK